LSFESGYKASFLKDSFELNATALSYLDPDYNLVVVEMVQSD